jgi:hypothetical protein
MKKLLTLCSLVLGFGVTGLLAEDATVSLPTPAPAPAATAPAANPAPTQGTAGSAKKHHKKHHKKKSGDAVTAPAADPKQ